MVIIFAGALGRFPVGGHAWVQLQYLLGLGELGHDVYFLEECGEGSWVYNWETEQITTDLEYPTNYVRKCLDPVGLGDRWIYRAGDSCLGMDLEKFREVCARADLLLVWASAIPLWRSEYDLPKRRIFIDADPGFTQFSLANGDHDLVATTARCERLFTIGQRIGTNGCPIPTLGREWRKTVSPVLLSHWLSARDGDAKYFTSIMQWRSYKDVSCNGVKYENKASEFPKFIDLPGSTKQPFLLALTGGQPQELATYGWEVTAGWVASRTPQAYRNFIQTSRAEFGVAKHGYVQTRGGWFSDRSACYLASGRPILVQDTGQAEWLPTGEGLLIFRDRSDALKGIEKINADYDYHCRRARALAEEYFASDV
ncbi:MAG: glycosyltransferase family 1 protein, partial [Gammaproteobacteria bacterium]